ncbi:MAG: hypothetical protein ACE5HI_14005, partial [bacterium]
MNSFKMLVGHTYQILLISVIMVFLYGCAGTKVKDIHKKDRPYLLNKIWEVGVNTYDNGKYKKSLRYFWMVIEKDTSREYGEVYTYLADSYFQIGKLDSSQLVYEMGIKKFPNNVELHRSLAHVYKIKQDIVKEITEYEKLIKLQPESLEDLNRLGDLYGRVERLQDAIRIYEKIANLDSENPEIHAILQVFREKVKNEEYRIADNLRKLEREPNNLQILNDLARS